MSVAAIMLVKDEADIIEPVVRHLLAEVDEVIVADNLSTDSTGAILVALAQEFPGRVDVRSDPEPGYYQAEKTSRLAREAHQRGHSWVVPADADEVWYSPHGRLGDVLEAQPREVLFARAPLVYHLPTALDDPALEDPLARIGWRFREDMQPSSMSKVACRTARDLAIDMGNHEAVSFGRVRSNWSHNVHGLVVARHYPWRSERQMLSKIGNGARAYAAAPNLSDEYGGHWKAHGLPGDPGFERSVVDWFRRWGYAPEPRVRADLMYDPVAAALAARTHILPA